MAEKIPPLTASLGFGISAVPTPEKQPERKARVLVVDPDTESVRFMNSRLAPSYFVDSVKDARAALDFCVRSRPNLVISDLDLAHMDGLSLLRELKSRWPALTVIIVTAHGTVAQAVAATQRGAFGFLVKPVEKGELLGQVERAIASSTFTLAAGDWRAQIVSRSKLMEERLSLANRAAHGDAPVLLTGENGTGKELLARAIHAASSRRDRPFVAVRIRDADPTSLAEELFGGGSAAGLGSAGAIQAARDGTLLLDEVGFLPHALQGELIRTIESDGRGVRLISTSSRDLQGLVEAGEFRRDLYYHLNVLPIEIPPLGRRREDIPLLVSHFLEQATEDGGGAKLYTPEAIELLATTDWPGNVRQLFELVKRNVALSHGRIMSKEFVQSSLGGRAKPVPTYEEARDKFARDYLVSNLSSTAGNVSQAARLAKRNRTDFYKLLARYRVEPDAFKGAPATDPKKPPAKE